MNPGKLLIIILLNIIALPDFASPKKLPALLSVSYQTVVNGKTNQEIPGPRLLCSPVASKSWLAKDSAKLLPAIALETSYVDYTLQKTFQVASFNNGTMINTSLEFSAYPPLTETNETAVILGYTCKRVKTSLRSNFIDIWYTTEAGVKGTPAMGYGIPEGLVLKIIRNGNYELVAIDLKPLKVKDAEPILPVQMGENLDSPLYKYRITKNLITKVPLFINEQISFGNKIDNPADSASPKTFRYASGTILLKKVKLPVVPEDTQLYAELYQHSNGDAYDRTGSVFMVPTDKEKSFLEGLRNGKDKLPAFLARNGKSYQGVTASEEFSPLVEIMRFFTPFGIGHFNDKVTVYGQHWEDSTY